MKMKKYLLTFACAGIALCASAADFFSTAKCDNLFDVNIVAGVNTSNRTISKDVFDEWNVNSWGTGFDIGATVDVNFREWISVQPGFFFESRSGNFAYSSAMQQADGSKNYYTQLGHGRSYNFTVPILASAHFNVTDDVRWNVEAGPYFQFGLKNTFSNKAHYPLAITAEYPDAIPSGWGTAKTRAFDFGLKFGTGITICDHYGFSVHYLCGWLDPWKPSALGGRNKEWIFTISYKL